MSEGINIRGNRVMVGCNRFGSIGWALGAATGYYLGTKQPMILSIGDGTICQYLGEFFTGADALGPDNILGFVSGLLVGTATMSGRWMAICKSPLTGGWGEANCGGNFAPAIKQCGYDGIFLKGISEKPVYLYVDNNGARLCDASRMSGVWIH